MVSLALSGKSASGKDAVAQRVQEMFPDLDWAGLSFGDAIKDEGRRLVTALECSRDRADATERIAVGLGVRHEDAVPLVDLLWTAVRRQELTSRLHHPLVRPALQRWGQLRVRDDAGYWIERAMRRLTALRDAGHSIVLTDMRMPWEADWARAQGFLLVRLEVSDEIRRDRTVSRDGAMLAPEVERDSTETAIDGYAGFDLRLDNSGDLSSVLAAIGSAVEEKWPRSSRSGTSHP